MNRAQTALFGSTLLLASALLFLMQPMVAREVLPHLGGSPAVWTTCMLFFQTMLLAGYAYAHTSSTCLGTRGQWALHALILGLAVFVVPIGGAPGWIDSFEDHPTLSLLRWLLGSAGLPIFVVAATSPLLQRWFADTGHPSRHDPYFLFAASNAGSFIALLAYPLWVERFLALPQQNAVWSLGLKGLAILVTLCAVLTELRGRKGQWGEIPSHRVDGLGFRAKTHEWRDWVILSAIPSSLMLGVTTSLTTDLAAIPLLWVVPLALYLLSYVLAFRKKPETTVRLARRILPLLVMLLAPVMGAGLVQPFWIPLHLLTFFCAAIVCHGLLASRRPPASDLTAFYLAIAIGGALGGFFNALVAPALFDRVAEYPIALVAACLVLAIQNGNGLRCMLAARVWALPLVITGIAALLCANVRGVADSVLGVVGTMLISGLSVLVVKTHRKQPGRFALAVGGLLAASGLAEGVSGHVIFRERSFFGVSRVTEVAEGRMHRLFHGSTLHGQQSMELERQREPLTYFTRSGPIGQVFDVFVKMTERKQGSVGVTGVGAGSLASYARAGENWTFYEIDPTVVRIARDPRYFTYLSDCRADSLKVTLGDARLTLRTAPERSFHLLILDAFSSDAIPMHLLTREAIQLYRKKVSRGGLIAVNISNRYLDLAPVLARLAEDAGMEVRVRVDAEVSPAEKLEGKQGSIWGLLAKSESDFGEIQHDRRWEIPKLIPGDRVWTDLFSSLVDHFRRGPLMSSGR